MERPSNTAAPELRLIHRETFLLVVLCVIAIVAFFVTRRVAGANRRLQREDAAHWYALGQTRLANDDPAEAVTALRRAKRFQREPIYHALLAQDGIHLPPPGRMPAALAPIA